MKMKILMAVMASILVLSSFVSATNQCGWESTIIDGTIYQAGGNPNANPIANADVTVVCEHNGQNSTAYATSNAQGHYAADFGSNECDLGDNVTVSASHPSYGDGEEPGSVQYNYEFGCGCEVNVGVVDVPLIPEFGIILGGLTILGSLVAFFVIRRN